MNRLKSFIFAVGEDRRIFESKNMPNKEAWNPRDEERYLAHPVERIALQIAKEISPNSVFLDFGCGHGRFFKYWISLLVPENVTILATDLNEKRLDLCDPGEKIKLFLADDYSLPLENNSIDFIFSNAVLIHQNIRTMCLFFQEFARILSNNGVMIHDIMDGDNEHSVEAVLTNQGRLPKPGRGEIHCYSWLVLQKLSERNGFTIEIFSRHGKRNLYKFTNRVYNSLPLA